MNTMLNDALQNKYCVPHFNINNLEWAKFILEEAENLRSPVILGVSEGAVKYMGGYNVVANMVKSLIKDLNITIPVIIHLDHGSSYETCKKAIDAGFSSVMIDASQYSLDKNIFVTNQVVRYAHINKISVESEIGHIGGNEDGVSSEIFYTNLSEAKTLYDNTQIDVLAPALGSVHGLYKGESKLDFERMQEISKNLNIPLVLHGGTGIPDEMIKRAIECGICKLNINTELQIAWSGAVRKFLKEDNSEYDPRKIIKSGEIALKEAVKNKILLLGSNNRL